MERVKRVGRKRARKGVYFQRVVFNFLLRNDLKFLVFFLFVWGGGGGSMFWVEKGGLFIRGQQCF